MISTNKEQAKKLIEGLNFDPESADMRWERDSMMSDSMSLVVGKPELSSDIPSWSVDRLIKLLPDEITDDNGDTYTPVFGKNVILYFNSKKSLCSFHGTDIIEMFIDCFTWLKENNFDIESDF